MCTAGRGAVGRESDDGAQPRDRVRPEPALVEERSFADPHRLRPVLHGAAHHTLRRPLRQVATSSHSLCYLVEFCVTVAAGISTWFLLYIWENCTKLRNLIDRENWWKYEDLIDSQGGECQCQDYRSKLQAYQLVSNRVFATLCCFSYNICYISTVVTYLLEYYLIS